jgi:hypothetical protein
MVAEKNKILVLFMEIKLVSYYVISYNIRTKTGKRNIKIPADSCMNRLRQENLSQ